MKYEELKKEINKDISNDGIKAEWVAINVGSTWSAFYRCSRCGNREVEATNYCPTCGAEMTNAGDLRKEK